MPDRPNYRPAASFTFTCADRTCTVDAASSSDSDGTLVSYGWQFDDGTAAGAQVTHTFLSTHNVRLLVMDDRGAIGTTVQNVNEPSVVSFGASCNGLTCTFDASASYDPDGTIAMSIWRFGDSKDGVSPAVMNHTYSSPGTYIVSLTLTDQDYGSATFSRSVTVNAANAPPNASFTYACNVLSCSFNASGSTDPDGTITSYAWDYGDGIAGSTATTTHIFPSPGSYPVTLLVTDNGNVTSTRTQVVAVYLPIHIGDIDVTTSNQSSLWNATAVVTIHDHTHRPVANVIVTGSWNDGVLSRVTDSAGRCSMSRQAISKRTASVSFTVANATVAMAVYTPTANHDPDRDSDGTTITARK